ncbi:hypothetical protein HDU93_008874, partial [Gonapodya sp. JEL0774]
MTAVPSSSAPRPLTTLNRLLIEAVESRSVEKARALLDEGASPRSRKLVASSKGETLGFREKDEYIRGQGESALLLAIVHGSAELVKLLIERGADPNEPCYFDVIILTSSGTLRYTGRNAAVALSGSGPTRTLARRGLPHIIDFALLDGRYKGGFNEKGGWVLDKEATDRMKVETDYEVVKALLDGGAVVDEARVERAAEVFEARATSSSLGGLFGKRKAQP